MEEIDNYEYNGFKIVIGYDQYSDGPDTWGNFTVKPWREVDGIDADERTLSDELKAKLKDGRAFWVDKFEHSQVSYSLNEDAKQYPYGEWDTSRQWGIIEFSDEYIAGTEPYEREIYARGDLATYTQWANGEVYYSYVYEIDPYTKEEVEQIDGSGGIYGYDEAKSMAESAADNLAPDRMSKYAKKAQQVHA